VKCNPRPVSLRSKEKDTVRSKRIPLFLHILADEFGQDLIEYALMAGFLAVGVGAIMPGFNEQIGQIYSRIMSSLSSVATYGS